MENAIPFINKLPYSSMTHFPSIVITGYGFITSLGDERNEVVQAIRNGQSGIAPATLDNGLNLLAGLVRDPQIVQGKGNESHKYIQKALTHALEESRLDPGSMDPWRVGIFAGSSKGRLENLFHTNGLHFNPHTFSGDTLGLSIAREYGFSGPVLNYPAACATGLHCLIHAIRYLQDGTIDLAVAGSGEAGCKPLVVAGFKNMGALSPEKMRPFDISRKGFNPGEGAAMFILEREVDARARNAKVLARICGWDQRSDAHHITSTEPSGATLAQSIQRSLKIAGWNREDVGYINAHGTGTAINDAVEGRAIIQSGGQDIPVSSLKPNIGHLLGASSAAELALSLACLQDGFIPPTLGLNNPDPSIPLHFVSPTGIHKSVRRFLKLSLGFGGHIGVLAVELP